jgi:hypothetical protein
VCSRDLVQSQESLPRPRVICPPRRLTQILDRLVPSFNIDGEDTDRKLEIPNCTWFRHDAKLGAPFCHA